MSVADKIIKLAASKNIAEDLDKDQLYRIAQDVIDGVKVDEESRESWLCQVSEGMALAKLITEQKNEPYFNAANVKFPIISNGAMTYAAREYQQLVRGAKLVETEVFGKDPQAQYQERAKRVAEYMSWCLLVKDDDYESDTYKLFMMLAIVGVVFRKIYWNPVLQRTVIELINPENVVVNNNVKSLKLARRTTHKIAMYKNDIVERERLGLFLEDYDYNPTPGMSESIINPEIQSDNTTDKDPQIEIYEQHTFLDLDEDGYAEPYIVTVCKKDLKIKRIVARYQLKNVSFTDDKKQIKAIKADQYFTDYHFIPNFDGTYYSIGFGTLLLPINEAVNTTFNQLLDAGRLLNERPIFLGAGCRIKDGEYKLKPGRMYKMEGAGGMDLKNSIVPLPVEEPSRVMFELLGMLVQSGKELASVSDILSGDMPSQNSPATTVLALIKQGLTQYNATHKYVLKSFQKEFKLIYITMSRNLDIQEYIDFCNDKNAGLDDFKEDDLHVRPVADPNMSSDAVRLATAQAVAQMPAVDHIAATRMMLQAMNVPDAQIQLLLPSNPPPPPEVQKMMAETQKIQAEAKDITLKHLAQAAQMQEDQKTTQQHSKELSIKNAVADSEIRLNNAKAKESQANAVNALAMADAAIQGITNQAHLDAWKAALAAAGNSVTGSVSQDKASNIHDGIMDSMDEDDNPQGGNDDNSNQGASGGVAAPPSDGQDDGSASASGGSLPGAIGGSGSPTNGQGGTPSSVPPG